MKPQIKQAALPVLLLLLLSAAGCQTGKPPEPTPISTPTPAPPPEPKPTPPEAVVQAGCVNDRVPNGRLWAEAVTPGGSYMVQAGTCHVQIGEGADSIRFVLPGMFDDEALPGLSVTPAEALDSTRMDHHRGDYLDVTLRPGKPGDRITVRWSGKDYDGTYYSLGFVLERLANPRVIGEYRQGQGEWQPWTEIPIVPRQPLSLRFRATGGLPVEQIADAVLDDVAGTTATVVAVSADTVEATLPEPPGLIFINFDGLEADHARVVTNGFTMYTGEPPLALWLDPATGREEAIGALPADIVLAELSPDGAHALLLAYAPESADLTRVYLLETATGRLHLTSFTDSWTGDRVSWLPDRVILPIYQNVQVLHLSDRREELLPTGIGYWGYISPDGRYLPGFRVDLDREDQTLRAPATIFLFDLQTGTERAFPDAVQVRVPHSSRPYYLPMAWEGSRLVMGEPIPQREPGQPERYQPVTLDSVTGEVTRGEGQEFKPDTWENGAIGPGGWRAAPRNWSEEITLTEPGGAKRSIGSGYAVGWAPDGRLLLLRWNPERRRIRETE